MNRIYPHIITVSASVLAVVLIIAGASHVGPLALACNGLAVALVLLVLRESPRVVAWVDRTLLRALGEPGR